MTAAIGKGVEGVEPHRRIEPISAINGLRGVAIAQVVFFHLVAGALPKDAMPAWISPLLTNGWTGVNLFFILSGFVLFLPHAADVSAMAERRQRLAFYRRRLRRLMPLFWVATLAAWALAAWQHHNPRVEELLGVLSLEFTVDPQRFAPSFNPSLWSIGVECVFSAAFPVLVLMARRTGIVRLVAMVLLLSLGMRLLGIYRLPATQGATFNSDAFVCRLDEFVLGMALARFYAGDRVPKYSGRWAAAGLGLVALGWIGFDMVLRGALAPLCRAPLNDLLDAGLFALIYASLAPATRLARSLAWQPLQRLGVMCYSIYIWHWPLLQLIAPNRAAMTPIELAVALPLFLTVTLLVGVLSYRFIEFPRGCRWPLITRQAA